MAKYIPFQKVSEDEEVVVYSYQNAAQAQEGSLLLIKATGETRPLEPAVADQSYPAVAAKLRRFWRNGDPFPDHGSHSA